MAYRKSNGAQSWVPLDNVINIHEIATRNPAKPKAKPVIVRKTVKSELRARVNDVEFTPERWFAATTTGVFITSDEGRTWHGGPVEKHTDFIAVKATPELAVAATRRNLIISLNGGESWHTVVLPEYVSSIADVAVDKSNIFLAAREGAFRSQDGGASWEYLRRLPVNQLASMVFDEESQKLIAISHTSTEMFESMDSGKTWKRAETGWQLRAVRSAHGRVIATTAFDGIVAKPEAVSAGSGVSSGSAMAAGRGANRQ
jgi:photosystem II stability/assembly factor-like uncharacterized protein